MQSEKRNNPDNYSKQIDESIANAEKRRKQALEGKSSLSDDQLEDVSGGNLLFTHPMGYINELL